jgi:membrane-associated phospholipid phosphatase
MCDLCAAEVDEEPREHPRFALARRAVMRNRVVTLPVLSIILLAGCATGTAQRGASSTAGAVDPDAGTWRTWVLGSGGDLRLPPPPDAQATAAELQQVRALAAQRDAAWLEKIRRWDFWSPAHPWNDVLTDISAANPIPGGAGIRAFAMMNVALHDALVAAWDSKYTHKRRRPAEIDGGPAAGIAVPRNPSYPCEHSVAAGAAAAVIAHIYPKQADQVSVLAEEAARSRILAGAAFPSDTKAGLDLGRMVAARVIAHMKIEGGKWTGTVPTGPGLWTGTNPVGVDEVQWRRLVLTSPSQFRPGPPPAPESRERAAELAEVKSFKRTPFTNSKVSYWQFGQQGQPGVLFRLSEEVGRRLAEDGLHASAPRAARAYALVHVAHYEGWIASQDAKFHFWTARPNQFDSTITTVVPTPPFPTYPSNAATLVMAPTVVLSYLFPRETQRYQAWAKEFGESRLWAGIHFRSDLTSGWEIGRRVGEAVVERAKRDGA